MRIDILTLFPEMFAGAVDSSIIKRAREAGAVDIRLHNFRDQALDKHHTVDDSPFGGGRYEGLDQRVVDHLVDREISVGDYVLSGGEPAALVVLDAVVRLLPGALGEPSSVEEESFSDGLLEYPQFTRPADFRGWQVPEVLLSGNHEAIRRWRQEMSLEETRKKRPDLLRGMQSVEANHG
jgi:tRNA (guanine37-N1)-methyltransferase